MSSRALAQAYSATGASWQRGAGRVYDRLAAVLVATSPVSLVGRSVLDLGAGTGAATRAIRGAGGTPIAADVALGMLRAIGPVRPPSMVADARMLPLADQSVEGVVAAFSLNHVPDPEHALREAARVVVPGSPLLVSAYANDDAHPAKAAVDAAAAELGWRPEPWVQELRSSSIPVLATVEGARRVTSDAGLHDADIRRIDVPFPDLDAADLVAWRCGMAQTAPFVATLTTTRRERLCARAIELLGEPPTLVRHVVIITAVT